jgi:ribosomal protein L7/L12
LAVGAGPVIYIKNTGEIFETGSGQSAEQYINAYRECGDVYGRLSQTIEIKLFNPTQDNKKAILSLKSVLGIGLAESKKLFEKMISEGELQLNMNDEWEAEEVKNKLSNLGFNVKRLWQKSR